MDRTLIRPTKIAPMGMARLLLLAVLAVAGLSLGQTSSLPPSSVALRAFSDLEKYLEATRIPCDAAIARAYSVCSAVRYSLPDLEKRLNNLQNERRLEAVVKLSWTRDRKFLTGSFVDRFYKVTFALTAASPGTIDRTRVVIQMVQFR